MEKHYAYEKKTMYPNCTLNSLFYSILHYNGILLLIFALTRKIFIIFLPQILKIKN